MANNYKSKLVHRTAKRKTERIDWASNIQLQAFEYGPYPLCMSGGYGSGKTFAGCFKILWMCDQFPKNRVLIARRHWTDLQKTTMATFFKLCPEDAYIHGGRRADGDKYLRLNNGSEILWAHLDSPETENMIQGVEINAFLIDQAEEVHEEIFEKLSARLGRWDQTVVPEAVIQRYNARFGEPWPWRTPKGKPTPPTFGMLTCNPDTKLHWIYRRFHNDSPEYWEKTMPDPLRPKSRRKFSFHDFHYRMFNMKSTDNKHLGEQNLMQLMSRDPSFRRRYVMGEWGMPEGTIHQVLPESILDPTEEVLKIVSDSARTYHRSYDHGETAPSCCLWWVMDNAGNYFMIREYYKGDALISQHRENIFELSRTEISKGIRYSSNLADPSIFHKTMQSKGGRYSASDEYEDRSYDPDTTLMWMAGDNDELGTRNRINELLREDPARIHPITGQIGAPRLYFLRKTPAYPNGSHYSVQQLEGQRRTKIGMSLGKPIFSDERDEKIVDHAYDPIRYFVAGRHRVPEDRKAKLVKGTFEGACLLVDKMARHNSKRMSRIARREARRYGRL